MSEYRYEQRREEIPPALTPEEWAGRPMYDTVDDGLTRGVQILKHADGEIEIVNLDGGNLPPEHHHALAALALYGQPFGFTHADMDAHYILTRFIGDFLVRESFEGRFHDKLRAAWEQNSDTMSRIHALLPPRVADREES